MDDQKKIFSQNLQRLLHERDKKQSEVADAIGVSRASLNMWVKGVTIPRMPKIQQLAKYFGVEVSELVDPQGEKYIDALNSGIIKLVDMRNHDFVMDMEFLSRKMSYENMDKIREYASLIKLKDDDDKKGGDD